MKIFRAISELEKIDLETYKIFRAREGAYEGKLFAESLKDATIFGKAFYFYDEEPIYVVRVKIKEKFVNNLGVDSPDKFLGVGSTISVDGENLEIFNNNMKFKILKYIRNA